MCPFKHVYIELFTVDLGMLEFNYRFQTWYKDFCNSKVQVRKCINSIIDTNKLGGVFKKRTKIRNNLQNKTNIQNSTRVAQK